MDLSTGQILAGVFPLLIFQGLFITVQKRALLCQLLSHSNLLSLIGNFILRRIYPQCISKDGHVEIPSMHFKWPNGQGTEKFFGGQKMSQSWMSEKGPIYQIWAGFRPEIVITQPTHLRDFFRDSDRHNKAKNNNSGWVIGQLLGSCVGLVSGDQWTRVRKSFEHHFSPPNAKASIRLIVQQAQDFVREDIRRDDPTSASFKFDVVETVKMYPFFLVATILFGELSGAQRELLLKLAPLREEVWKVGIRGGLYRTEMCKWLRLPGYKLLAEYKALWRSFLEAAVAESIEHGKNDPIEVLWKTAQAGQLLTLEECMQTLDEALYANLDVTTNAISWVHVLLAQHESFQKEVQDEASEHKSGTDETWQNYINRSDTLLAYSVLESSRLRPILRKSNPFFHRDGPFSNPESAIENRLVGDVMVPRNVDVIVDTRAINVSNPFWVDGAMFNPRRFEKLKQTEYRYHFWRFGFGPRRCLGQHLADRVIRAVVAELLCEYHISLAPQDQIHDFGLQEESWVGLPNVEVCCERLKAA